MLRWTVLEIEAESVIRIELISVRLAPLTLVWDKTTTYGSQRSFPSGDDALLGPSIQQRLEELDLPIRILWTGIRIALQRGELALRRGMLGRS